MHRDSLSWLTVSKCVRVTAAHPFALLTCVRRSGYLMTASVDGHLKFWKKRDQDDGPGIESVDTLSVGSWLIQGPSRFVKHYRAHLSPIISVSVSADGSTYATTAADLSAGAKGSVKVFDVQNFGTDHRDAKKLPFWI